jgi:HK97 family phage major capsid protein
VTKVTKDLGRAITTLMSLNVDLEGGGAGWLLPVSVYNYLHQACDANSNRIWRDEMDKGLLEGFPFAVSSQIPENISSTKTEVYFVNFKSCVIAENETMEVAVFPGGAYYDGSSVVSGISQNQTVIRVLAKHDFGCQYRGQEIAVYTDVDWGD